MMTGTRWTVGLICAASVALCAAPGAHAQAVWTFDCGLEGWGPANNITATWENRAGGKFVYVPIGGDPHGSRAYAAPLADNQYLRFSMDAGTQPVQARGFVYFFTDAGHAGIPFNLVDGPNVYTIDLMNDAVEDDGGGQGGTNLTMIRLDLPQGNETEFANHEFVIDWMSLGTDNAFVPAVQDTDLDCDGLTNDEEALYGTNPEMADTDGDGLSDYEEIAWDGDDSSYAPGVDLDPLNADTDGDGYPDGMEIRYGTSPLDANDYPPPMPATSNTGLWILIALMIGAVVFTLAVRKARNHS